VTERGQGADTAADETKRTVSTAAEESTHVVGMATEGAKQVAQEAGNQARQVIQEAGTQIRSLAEQGQAQLRIQAEHQTRRASQNLRNLAEQADALADGRVDEAGPMAEHVRRVASQLADSADRLDRRGFDGLIGDIRSFARRRPAAFIGLTALAGFAVSRIGRNMSGSQNGHGGGNQPALSMGGIDDGGPSLPNAEPYGQRYADDAPQGSGMTADAIIEEDIVVVADEIVPESYGNATSGRAGTGGTGTRGA
jgi:hypothetical protein